LSLLQRSPIMDGLSGRGNVLFAIDSLNLGDGLLGGKSFGSDVDLGGFFDAVFAGMLGSYLDVAATISALGTSSRCVGDRLKSALHGPGASTSVGNSLVDTGSLTGERSVYLFTRSEVDVEERQDLRRRDGRGRSEVGSTSRRLVAAVGADVLNATIESRHVGRRGVFHRVAVLSAAPVATFLALLLQLLLSLGVGKTEAKLDTIMLDKVAVVLADDTFGNLTGLESACVRFRETADSITYLAKPTSLLTPEGTSRQIFVEMAL
jgi:hypothetical protein